MPTCLWPPAGDSVLLKKVSGTVVPSTSRFVATGGQLAWTIKQQPGDGRPGRLRLRLDQARVHGPARDPDLPGRAGSARERRPELQERAAASPAPPTPATRASSPSPTMPASRTWATTSSYRGGISLAGSQLLSAALDGSLSQHHGEPGRQAQVQGRLAGLRARRLADYGQPGRHYHLPGHQRLADAPRRAAQVLPRTSSSCKLAREEGLYKTRPTATPTTRWISAPRP